MTDTDRAQLVDVGDSQVVLFPKGYEFSTKWVSFLRAGDAVIVTPVRSRWALWLINLLRWLKRDRDVRIQRGRDRAISNIDTLIAGQALAPSQETEAK